MTDSSQSNKARTTASGAAEINPKMSAKTALFWDESFLWGLIAYKTLSAVGADFDLVTAADIRDGALDSYEILFVPGGWASNKIKALRPDGVERVRSFVKNGGSYLGFCGGAGLALAHENGLALAPIGRKPTNMRVPSFSGKIKLRELASKHPMWDGIAEGSSFYAWWPGMFSVQEIDGIKTLARYGEPEEGSYVADLVVGPSVDWEKHEKEYRTNLNPARIQGEPAVIETTYGAGRVLLSYLHFETPEDSLGHTVLLNMLSYLGAGKNRLSKKHTLDSQAKAAPSPVTGDSAKAVTAARALEAAALDLIGFGEKLGLWFWRKPWIIQWQRGVRGIEYCTLYIMLRKLSELVAEQTDDDIDLGSALEETYPQVLSFTGDAKKLLELEERAIGQGYITPLKSDDPEIQALREKLFSNTKSFGGSFKDILDKIDALVLALLRGR
ncbi:MAG: BPL-N domain-containing protein [Candidatus Aquicultor sp.]|nr:BPL-N domain-containing protein [Candidatus Aquicultor sp.]